MTIKCCFSCLLSEWRPISSVILTKLLLLVPGIVDVGGLQVESFAIPYQTEYILIQEAEKYFFTLLKRCAI